MSQNKWVLQQHGYRGWSTYKYQNSRTIAAAPKIVAEGINKIRSKERGILLITHYNRILKYVKPDKILVLVDGKIVASDGPELANQIEEEGYKKWTKTK